MSRPTPSLEDCKRQVSLLIKDLRAKDTVRARAAAERFRRIAPFRDQTSDEVLAARETLQRKHALKVIAREHGYPAWKNLKDASDVFWCPPGTSAFWHNWCKTYEEAREHLEARGGYLLFGHGKCFIAERGYIESLGLDPDDPRWQAIGFDAKQPRDVQAYADLVEQLARLRTLR